MRFPPPEVIAAWPEPNYVDPERRGHVNTIVQVILVTIVTAFVAIRIYARLIITRARIGLDDIIIVISWVRLLAGVARRANTERYPSDIRSGLDCWGCACIAKVWLGFTHLGSPT